MRRCLVLGAGGFIGSHLVKRLKDEGEYVEGADLKLPEFGPTAADAFHTTDLRVPAACDWLIQRQFDEIYQLAADMGGAGFVFTGENDAAILHNSALINLNVAEAVKLHGAGKVLYTSSACVYPDMPEFYCRERDAYPAEPDSDYGFEKLFSERLWQAYARNHGISVRIVRLHNVFGPEGAWNNGREKAPAALCRKVAEASDPGSIDIWGDGKQMRSFLYIDECVEGLQRIMDSDLDEPVNLGSERMVLIDEFARIIAGVAMKQISLRHIPGPVGVRGRCSDNTLLREQTGWSPAERLKEGLEATYRWISAQVEAQREAA